MTDKNLATKIMDSIKYITNWFIRTRKRGKNFIEKKNKSQKTKRNESFKEKTT